MADADSDGQASTISEQKNRSKDALKGKRKGDKSLIVSREVYVTVFVWEKTSIWSKNNSNFQRLSHKTRRTLNALISIRSMNFSK